MAKLPSALDIRRKTAPASSPGINARPVDYSPLNRGAAALSNDLKTMAAGEEVDDFETRKKMIDFKLRAEIGLEEDARNINAGGDGFTDFAHEAFKYRASEFVGKNDSNIPESQRAKVGYELKKFEATLARRANRYEMKERDSHHINQIETTLGTLSEQVSVNPERLTEMETEGMKLIDLSKLTTGTKRALGDKYRHAIRVAQADTGLSRIRSKADLEAFQESLKLSGKSKSGVASFVDKIIGVESGRRANAKNSLSSAAGSGQFIENTWIAMIKQHRPDLFKGRTRKQILALRNNMAISKEMTTAYAEDNALILSRGGVETNARNIYLAHFLGPRTAIKVLRSGDRAATSILSQKVIKANPFLKNKTARQIVAWASRKMGKASNQPAHDLNYDERQTYLDKANRIYGQYVKNADKSIIGLEQHLTSGHKMPASRLAQIRQTVDSLEDPGLLQRLKTAEAFGEAVQTFQSRPVAINEAEVQGIRARFKNNEIPPEQLEVIKKLEASNAKQHTTLKNDALTWAYRSGSVPVGPLDFGSEISLARRLEDAKKTQEQYHSPIQYFTKSERDRFAEIAKKGGTEYLMTVGRMAESWGQEHTVRAIGELNDKAPEAAIAGWLLASNTNPGVAQEIMASIKHRSDPNYISNKPSKMDVESSAQSVLSDAFDAFPPEQRDAVLNAAVSLYEYRNEAPNGETDATLMKRSINDVIGYREIKGEGYGGISKPGFFGSGKAIIVPPNIKTDEFHDVFESIKLEDLENKPLHEDKNAVSETDFKRGKPVQVGADLFAINIGSDSSPQYLMDDKGEHYLINIKSMEDILRKRNPDAYLVN
jgi:hypothetical protein